MLVCNRVTTKIRWSSTSVLETRARTSGNDASNTTRFSAVRLSSAYLVIDLALSVAAPHFGKSLLYFIYSWLAYVDMQFDRPVRLWRIWSCTRLCCLCWQVLQNLDFMYTCCRYGAVLKSWGQRLRWKVYEVVLLLGLPEDNWE